MACSSASFFCRASSAASCASWPRYVFSKNGHTSATLHHAAPTPPPVWAGSPAPASQRMIRVRCRAASRSCLQPIPAPTCVAPSGNFYHRPRISRTSHIGNNPYRTQRMKRTCASLPRIRLRPRDLRRRKAFCTSALITNTLTISANP
jgi:hypothetical protein